MQRIYSQYKIKKVSRNFFQVTTLEREYVAWEGTLWWNGNRYIATVSPILHRYLWCAEAWIDAGCTPTYEHFTLVWASDNDSGRLYTERRLYALLQDRFDDEENAAIP